MKPTEARNRYKALAQARAVRGERLESVLRHGAEPDKPRPDLVPTEQDKTNAKRRYRQCCREAAGVRGRKKEAWLDLAVVELARLIYIERVLALDPLDRAALTPARLTMLSVVDPDEIRRRFDALQEGEDR